MTSNKEMIAEVVAGFMSNGINGLRESLERLFNELMVAEREQFVNAAPYERTDQRKAYCNGFKDKKRLTKNGELHLRVPQVRGESFYPGCLEKGERTEQAPKLVFAEAYIQGVGTRKMKQLAEELCGKEISATQVSSTPYKKLLIIFYSTKEGYSLCSLVLASLVVNCQLHFTLKRFRATSQALISLINVS